MTRPPGPPYTTDSFVGSLGSRELDNNSLFFIQSLRPLLTSSFPFFHFFEHMLNVTNKACFATRVAVGVIPAVLM